MEMKNNAGQLLLGIARPDLESICRPTQFPVYTLYYLHAGHGNFHADFGVFEFTAPVLLFSTPMQLVRIDECQNLTVTRLQFHSDFYCIEYHRQEVACNGLLFNNIYIDPVVQLSDKESVIFEMFLDNMRDEFSQEKPSETVLQAYLQLFLAKSSSIKLSSMAEVSTKVEMDEMMEKFRALLDKNFLNLHKPSEYASLLAMTPDNLNKRSTRYFKKTPSQLIQERLVLEAKKQLHLTRQSIKEIAYNLRFQDEFYFSRFFKKITKVSPQAFREYTGISIVADLADPDFKDLSKL
ncbi:helix-turn-helix domain-containing protein [Mucilaginibacter aquariorum]|uniref:AraC family transcriptional regulator n=1 Tax=Mucilaginibacter aquariorum TaxID=2967225 RepID=A0ABT1SXH5_9SPHI|nr:helix-turn-helix domain-containing protein [Mucilaginibacter aquariorum]MCQ6957044.1 AraC family transcriptional regulator [Mucilaginibacter aquariorum]